MPESNDYVNWVVTNTAKQKKHEKNTALKQKYGEELSSNRHLALTTDEIKPYKQPLREYQHPIVEVLEGDLRSRVLGELKIQQKKSASKNMEISYGPRTYKIAS